MPPTTEERIVRLECKQVEVETTLLGHLHEHIERERASRHMIWSLILTLLASVFTAAGSVAVMLVRGG